MLCVCSLKLLVKRPLQSIGECSQSIAIGLLARRKGDVCSPTGTRCYHSNHTSRSAATGPVTTQYESLVTTGKIQFDHHQRQAVISLQVLQNHLEKTEGGLGGGESLSWLRKAFGGQSTPKHKVKGIYMYGSVGAGKTMLMDMFFESTNIARKQRLHFNEFMMDAHKRIHRFKQALPSSVGRKSRTYDPIAPVAHDIASEVNLLCFDEFQVTDIGDAMILKRLFTTLFDDGVVVVATSNRPPEDLYKHGLQRGNFLPFIDILKANCSIVHLSPGQDYRQSILGMEGEDVYIHPNSSDNNDKLMNMFTRMSEDNRNKISPKQLQFFGRHLQVNRAAGNAAYFEFSELCEQPLSAVDFLEICRAFEIVFIQDIPRLTKSMRPQAKRFITLVDTLYDHKVKLICTANGSENELLFDPTNIEPSSSTTDEERALMDDLGIDQNTASQTSIFTGEEELFASARTVSRLKEMQGQEYWEAPHVAPRRD